MAGRVAVLHHERSFFPLDLHEAAAGGAELVWVLVDDAGQDLAARRLLQRLGTVVTIDSDDLDTAAERLAAAGISGVVTFVDDHLVLTAEIAQRLNLPYHSPQVAQTIRDKSAQRAALSAAGVAGPRFWRLPPGLDHRALMETARQVQFPAVLKPAFGSGSRGILSVDGPEELAELYEPQTEQLVEEYLEDDPDRDPRFASYLSVESVVSYRHISHVAVTGRFPLAEPYRETGNFIPACVRAGQRDGILQLASEAITSLGIEGAVVHTEIKLTPEGPRLIEVNGRLGGRPPFVLRSVSDVNLFDAAFRIALGEEVRYDGLVECRGVGFWRMLQPPLSARRVLEVRGLSELSQDPSVDIAALKRAGGERVDAGDGTDGAVVTVRGKVADLDELAAMIKRIDERVQVDYEMA